MKRLSAGEGAVKDVAVVATAAGAAETGAHSSKMKVQRDSETGGQGLLKFPARPEHFQKKDIPQHDLDY